MEVKKLIPNGYCYGVVDAINKILELIESDCPKPIHIYGMLIHNEHIANAFLEKGVITHVNPSTSLLDEIEGTVVFTAHGTRNSVIEHAKNRGLNVVNTVCRDVNNTINLINEYVNNGYEVLYIGKMDHPEAIASTELDKVHLITCKEDFHKYDVNKLYAITNQTTLSSLELYDMYEYAKDYFTNIEILEELCNATKSRQQAVLNNLDSDLLIVVGDKKSNNSNSLAKIHHNGILIQSYEDLVDCDLTFNKISVTAGASTPRAVINQVLEYLYAKSSGKIVNLHKLSSDELLRLK